MDIAALPNSYLLVLAYVLEVHDLQCRSTTYLF